jgi:hypothetical protein
VPEETTRVARAAFPTGNMYIRLRDQLGSVYEDASFSGMFPARGQPAGHRGDWLWSRCCSLLKVYPIAMRRMRCEAASIGNTCSAWN